MHPVLQSHNFLYKTSGLLGFGYNFIPILCLVGAYSISVTRTHPTGEEQLTSAERTRRSLIHSAALTYEIQEESLRGTLVGNVGRDILALVSSTSTRYTSDQTLSDQVDLTITNWRDRAVQLFHLDPASGQLRVASTPDREVLCPASSGTVAENQDNYVHLTHDKAKSTHLDDEHNVVQSHSNEISPCFVDVKIAYTLRRTKLPTEDVTTTQTVFDPGLITARIRILDINDHTPVFPQSRVSTELGELSAVPENTAIDLPTAFDPDSGENGTIGYWVADRTAGSNVPGRSYDSTTKKNLDAEFGQPNIPFRLVGDPLRLVLTRNLDWESKREYDLVVYAKDYGKPQSLTGQLSVHVTVRDENDNVPQFEQSSYTAVINESVLRGTIILELTASDADSATNGQLTFGLAPPINSQERLAMQFFGIRTISPTQAAIYVIQTPDVDGTPKTTFSERHLSNSVELIRGSEKVGKQFNFHVIVRDNGYPRQLSSRAEVTILVLDVNDMVPNIFVSYLTLSQTGGNQLSRTEFGRSPTSTERNYGQVKENSDRAFIAFVTVHDFDSGVWGQVRCYTNNDAFELTPVNEASVGLGVSVEQFVGPIHQSTGLSESTTGETGFKLLAVKPFDREKTEEISFHIICVDNPHHVGSSYVNYATAVGSYYTSSSQTGFTSSNPTAGAIQLTGTALVRILITDENDNVPVFTRTQYTFAMDEADGSVGRSTVIMATDTQLFVGRVSASDQDSTSHVTYSLPEDLATHFRIESESGKIYALSQFDREEIVHKMKLGDYPQSETFRAEVEHDKMVYLHFPVFSTDGLHNSSAKVRLLIRDVNDNPPVFSKTQYEFVVPENEQPIQSGSIGTVEAQDEDADANAQIIYQIYDVTDSIPMTGKSVVANQSTRAVRFGNNNIFTISAKSGHLHLIRKLDREKQSHHIFYVLAIDNPVNVHMDRTWPTGSSQMDGKTHLRKSHTATATVTVIVADMNDNAPTITYPPPHGVINVESGAPAGHNLFTVIAHDPDAGDNGTIRFTLSVANFDRAAKHQSELGEHSTGTSAEIVEKSSSTSSAASPSTSSDTDASTKSGLFSIDAVTGIVFLAEKITDQSANYLLVIGAHDLGHPHQRKSTTTVTVRAHNSQLLQALNPYRFDGLPGAASDNRHPRGPGVISEGSNPKGAILGNIADFSRVNPDEARPPPIIGRDTNAVIGNEMDFDSTDNSAMNSSGMRGRFTSITDRTVVVVLATIFALLLMTTVVLVLLIKRRRDAENQSSVARKQYDRTSPNNTPRQDQQIFSQTKSAALSRLDPTSPGSGSCTLNSTANKSGELATIPRLHPYILHDPHLQVDELDHLEYGSPVYGKAALYSGEALTLIPSSGDYQRPMPACLFDRTQTDRGINSADERLSNSAELLSNTAMTFGENVTLGRKANGPMSHQVRALCSPAEADFYRKQSFLLNDRKARNSKRYQTIDPLLGTFCTDRQGQPKKSVQQMMINNCHTNNNNTNQNNFLTPATTNAAVAPSTILKHKDAITDEPIGRTKIHQSNNPTLTYQVNISCGTDSAMKSERRQEVADTLDELALQLHQIRQTEDIGSAGTALGSRSNTCLASAATRKSISSSRPSQSSSSNSPPCDLSSTGLGDGQHKSVRPAISMTVTSEACCNRTNSSDDGTLRQTLPNVNSTVNTASKGVSFV